MYSTNLTKIGIDQFRETLKKIHLLPSHRILLNDIDRNFNKLKNEGVKNLADIQKILKNKKEQQTIAKKLEIDTDYLVILLRVVNGYEVKAVALDKLEIFSDEEISKLKANDLKTSKEYYEFFVKRNQSISGIANEKLEYALHIIDLLRINGVGLEYAKILYEMGIKSVQDYKNTSSEVILNRFNDVNQNRQLTKSKLGLNDVEYCRRFCEVLDCDI